MHFALASFVLVVTVVFVLRAVVVWRGIGGAGADVFVIPPHANALTSPHSILPRSSFLLCAALAPRCAGDNFRDRQGGELRG
jgi:hypothetical protein